MDFFRSGTMAQKIYDVIVIGTGAGGGMAIKTLCEAGLKVCALNAGRRLDPEKDFPGAGHKMDVAALQRRGRQDKFLGTKFGTLWRH